MATAPMTRRRLGQPVLAGQAEVVTVERLRASAHLVAGRLLATASIDAEAIVVRTPARTRAVDLEGRAISLDALRRDVPGLAAWLDESPGALG